MELLELVCVNMKKKQYQIVHFFITLLFIPLFYRSLDKSIVFMMVVILLLNIPSFYFLNGKRVSFAIFQVLWDISIIIVGVWLFS